MKNRFFVAMIVSLGLFGFAPMARAQEKAVLIVNSDGAEQSELASNLYRKVVATISAHLENAGYQTLRDESLGQAREDPLISMADAKLLARVRARNYNDVGYVAVVQILANMVLLQDGTRVDVEIRGRMLQVENGNVLARFDLPVPNSLSAPPDCDRKCIIQLLEQNTTFLADSLGQVLAQRLKRDD